MFYLLIIPALIMLSFMIMQFYAIKKHDKVLFEFCQARRDLMGILRRDNVNISKKNYVALTKLVEFLNRTIHNYDEMKTSLFNIRKFFRYLKQYEKDIKKIEKIKIPDNPEVIEIYRKSSIAMLKAFLTYTPFIKSQLCLYLLVHLLKTIGYFSKKQVDNYVQILTQIKLKTHEFGIPLRTL